MIAFLRTFLAAVLAIFFVAACPLVFLLLLALAVDTGPQDGTWLTIRLGGPLLEHYGPVSWRNVFDEHPPCLSEITENLEKAAVDDRIDGVLFQLDWFGAGTGKLDEIRAGIRRVRETGKPVYAYGATLRDGGVYLGSECDATFLFPKGLVYFLGRGVSIEHLKGTLEKLEVKDQLHRIEEYKSAAELFTAKESSPETIENLRWVLEDLDAAFDRVLSRNLSLDPDDLAELRERGVLLAYEAVESGLVSEMLYWDELVERLERDGKELRTISSAEYANVDRHSVGLGGKTRVAVVHAQGFVASGGTDRYTPMSGLTMGTDRVVEDLRRARDDDRVKAIIVRWDTGGGATDGAERVARAVARARDEKPVVVSIADQAASGGYMMSYPADYIVCPANGITGSIGSITGKFNVRGFWEKLGISYDHVALAPNAFLLSELHDYTEEQWKRIEEVHWETYNEWIAEIAEARDLTFEEVDEAGQGRVWTGRQAKERRLVDKLGTFDTALAAVRRLVDLREDENVTIVHYPERQTVVDFLLSGDFTQAVAHDVVRDVRQALFPRIAPRELRHFSTFRVE